MTKLYIKTHNVTGLKYFGKTVKEDCHKYQGSGKHWIRHIKKHSYDVTTVIHGEFDETNPIERALLVDCALIFSEVNNIVKSKEWANMIPENGLDGASVKGRINIHKGKLEKRIEPEELDEYLEEGWIRGISDEHRGKMSKAATGKTMSAENIAKRSKTNTGSKRSNETKANMSAAQLNMTDETKAKMTNAALNMSDEHKANLSKAALNRSDEHKANLSKAQTGKPHSAKRKAINSAARKGKIAIHNIIENNAKMIKPQDFPEYQSKGWLKGRLPKEI